MSNRDADVAIISMAQQANPNPIGQSEDWRAQLSTLSRLVVMKLSSNRCSSKPIGQSFAYLPSNQLALVSMKLCH